MNESTIREIIREELVRAAGGVPVVRETASAKVCAQMFGLNGRQLKNLWLGGYIRGRKLGDGKGAGMLYNLADLRDFLGQRAGVEPEMDGGV